MSNKKSILSLFLIHLFFTSTVQSINVTQPIGTLVRTYETNPPLPFPIQPPALDPARGIPLPTVGVGEVNYICAQWDSEEILGTEPFDINYPATEIILTKPQHFVRLLVGTSSGANGSWIMRSEYVRGKTRAQLQDIFALASLPLDIVNVEMPASPDPVTNKNYALWTGIAGPIWFPGHYWGQGGAPQHRLIADFNGTNYFPNYIFTSPNTRNHRQPVGEIALSYKPLAGNGNSLKIATYLDSYLPIAYSDLENVYHSLDYLNYVDYGNDPIQNGLNQISPERFDTLSFLSFRNTMLFGTTILNEQTFKKRENYCTKYCKIDDQRHNSKPHFNTQCLMEFDNRNPSPTINNYHNKTAGLLANMTFQPHDNFSWGIGIAGMGNKLQWKNSGGYILGGSAKVGLYGNYSLKHFFLNGLISGGANWNSITRHINFDVINRNAYSKPHGGDIAIFLQGSVNIFNCLSPIAQIDYSFDKQNHFIENSADSLNLNVKSFSSHNLRINLGTNINPTLNVNKNFKIIPNASLAWINDIPLYKQKIKASIIGPNGNMKIKRPFTQDGYFNWGAGCNILFCNSCTIFARYDQEICKHFTAQLIKAGFAATF